MSVHKKLHLTAAAFLLLALGILLWPPAQKPTIASTSTTEGAHSIRRESNSPQPPLSPERAKEFQSLTKHLESHGRRLKITWQEVDHFVDAQHRSMASLLTAFRLSEDPAYLKEALANFPNHPQVLLCALQLDPDPAKRLELLESFKRADPGNGIGNCLTAKALFDLGKNDEAFAELLQSRGKPIQDFWINSSQSDEEAYLSAGFSPIDAKIISLFGSSKSDLTQIHGITKKLDELRANYASAGNSEAVQSVRNIQSEMGRQLQQDRSLVGELIGIAAEKGALRGLDDPASIARMAEIDRQQKSVSEGNQKISALMENATVPESDWLLYFDRAKLFGERAAMDWMLGKHPEP